MRFKVEGLKGRKFINAKNLYDAASIIKNRIKDEDVYVDFRANTVHIISVNHRITIEGEKGWRKKKSQ